MSTLINSHATLVLAGLTGTRELRKLSCKLSLVNTHQLSCNSCSRRFDRDTRVEKILMQTLACQLLSNLMQLFFWFNLTGTRELRKFACKLSLVNSHQLSYNSCSRLIGAGELRKLSCKLSLVNSHQLSYNSCSRLIGTRELRELCDAYSCLPSLFISVCMNRTLASFYGLFILFSLSDKINHL